MTRSYRFLLAFLSVLLLGAVAGASGAAASSRADAQQALAQAQALFGGAMPWAAGSAAGVSGHEATPILLTLARNLDSLPPAQQAEARQLLERPSQSSDKDNFGPEAAASPVCDAHFCVHWGTKSGSVPIAGDSNSNGVPDYAEQVLAAGDTSWSVENDSLGWNKAPSDGKLGERKGLGGQGQTDVYITGLPRGLYGYSTTDPGQRGPRQAGYLVVDNDYNGFGGVPVQLMQVTFAHEYNHVLQFGYDTYQDSWMFESTATFMENNVFPNVDDYLNYVPQFARNSRTPLAETERNAFKLYGSAVWNHYLAGAYGPAVVRDAWAVSTKVRPADFAVAAYDKAIKSDGGKGFAPAFVNFAAESAEWKASSLFPDIYPDMNRAGSLGNASQKIKLNHTGYELFNVTPQAGTVTLHVSGGSKTRSGIALVGRVGSPTGGTIERAMEYLPKGGKTSVSLPDAGKYARITAVVVNADGRVKGNSRNYTHDGVSYKISLG